MAFITQPLMGVDLTLTTTSIGQYRLGERLMASDGVYQYVSAAAAVAQYAFVKISATFTIAEGTTTTNPSTEPAKAGAAQVALAVPVSPATATFGWVFIGPGLATVKCAASCVQDVKLYTTATAGVVDDAATTLVNGLKLIATITGAAASPCAAACEMGTAIA